MHVCFVVDNSQLTKQTYNFSNSANSTHSNITILDTIKISIETMLNEMSRNGIPIWQYQKLHLFATSNPSMPISSFQHNQLHFNYQLKQLRSSDSITFPAQTLRFVLKHISKFRVLTEAQTALGYRASSIYEPVLIIFFSYGLTLRKITKLQAAGIHKLMRSQYKFIHYRMCFPSQSEKDRNFEKFRAETETNPEHKKLVQFAERFNRGEHKNIIKYSGKQSLTDLLMKAITTFKPTLCCYFIFDSQIKVQFQEYFINSQLRPQNFIITDDNGFYKAELHKNEQNHKNFIVFPQQILLKESQHNMQQLGIEQIGPLQFFVDVGKKLPGPLSKTVPFNSYIMMHVPSKFSKLQKQLERLNINQIYFPVYVAHTNPKKQKQYFLIGLLHFFRDNKVNKFYQILISFPNFPTVQWIINFISNQKSYTDGRKLQKILVDYHNSIPQFYHKFIAQYFKMSSKTIPTLSIYETIAANNWANLSNLSPAYKTSMQKLQVLKKAASDKYIINLKISQQNLIKHAQGRAECCPIYNSLEAYIAYSKNLSKVKNPNLSIFYDTIDKVFQFNTKSGFKSYFSEKAQEKLGPMAREIQKYTNKFAYGEGYKFQEDNQSITVSPSGLIPVKKRRPEQISDNSQGFNAVISDSQSVMPEIKQNYEQNFSLSIEMRDIAEGLQESFFSNPNSIASDPYKKSLQDLPANQLIQVERDLLINKMEVEQSSQFLETIKKRSSGQQIVVTNQQKQKQKQGNDKDKPNNQRQPANKLLKYVNQIELQSPVTMILNNSNMNPQKFQSNILKLQRIGLVTKADLYIRK